MPRNKAGGQAPPSRKIDPKPLLPDAPQPNEEKAWEVPVSTVAPCPQNLRGDDLWDDLREREETIESLKALGLLQALVVVELSEYLKVYPADGGKFASEIKYVIATGHKRFDCVTELKWPKVRIDVQNNLAPHLDEVFLDENLHRSALNAFQEAEGYARLRVKLSDAQIAARYGIKSKSRVSKRVAILPLQDVPEARGAVVSGAMSPDMAHRLLTAVGRVPELVIPAFNLMREERLDVKEAARRIVVGGDSDRTSEDHSVPAQPGPSDPGSSDETSDEEAGTASESDDAALSGAANDAQGGSSVQQASTSVAGGATQSRGNSGSGGTQPGPRSVSRRHGGESEATEMERSRAETAVRREDHCQKLVEQYAEPSEVDAQTLHTAATAVAMVASAPLELAHKWMVAAGVSEAQAYKPDSYRDNILAGGDSALLLRFAYAAALAENETHSQDRRRATPGYRAIRHWKYLIEAAGYDPGIWEKQYLG